MFKKPKVYILPLSLTLSLLSIACQNVQKDTPLTEERTLQAISKPLVTHIFTADPSAHVFDGKIYIYPSHDVDSGLKTTEDGSHFDMKDYHVFSLDSIDGEVTDHGVALDVKNVPWATKQMWAPDAAYKNGTYYLYFPAKDSNDIFKIGVATSSNPAGPFNPQPQPIKGSFSIDPSVFTDTDGESYMYFGGIFGGQLQKWKTGEYDPHGKEQEDDKPALSPKIAKLGEDMLQFAETPKDVLILDDEGNPLLAGDTERRFFEAAWVHKYNDKYYFSYSTGDTHKIVYATGDNPYGPFTYQGIILNPVLGWTNHHSIIEFDSKWYLFYHDSEISEGITHLRNIKMTELKYDDEGNIIPISPYLN